MYKLYVAAKEESSEKDTDDIFTEFDEKWSNEHLEFYDIQRLLN